MTPVIRILIVDDDEEDRQLFCEAAEELHSPVICEHAIDGEDALALLTKDRNRPDYIFLDLNMPRVNGIQFLKRVKKIPALEAIPVIIYTTSKRVEHKQEAMALGAVHFISKPDNSSDLRKAISFVLERKWEKMSQ